MPDAFPAMLAADRVSGRAAHRIAESIGAPIDAPVEAALLRADRPQLYGGVNYHKAALTLRICELRLALTAGVPLTDLAWVRLAAQAIDAARLAFAQREAPPLAEVDRLISLLRRATPPEAVTAGAVAEFAAALDQTSADASAAMQLYLSEQAARSGELEGAATHLAEAHRAAHSATPLQRIAVLNAMGRTSEVQLLTMALIGALDNAQSAVLLVRVRMYTYAYDVLTRLQAEGIGPELLGPPWMWPALWAETLLGLNRPEQALPWAVKAVRALESHLSSIQPDVFRLTASDDPVVARVYTLAVTCYTHLATTGRPTAAQFLSLGFELSDRCRGASLGELTRPRRSGDPQRAAAQLARTIEEFGDPVGWPSPQTVESVVRSAERDLEDAEAPLQQTAAPPPATKTLADIQQALAQDTLLLQYHAFDNELIGWAITRDSAEVYRIRYDTMELVWRAAALHRAVADPRSSPAEIDALAEPLSVLLRLFQTQLRDHRRVVIVPHGPLALLPIHVLPHDGQPLGWTHVCSYLPAASLVRPPQAHLRTDSEVLVVGDPAFHDDRRLSRLDGARVEAHHVARVHGTAAITDAEATRARILPKLATARIAHLATHGRFRSGAPYSTELALAGHDSLTVPDLIGSRLRVELAILSACDSGRGRATAAGDFVGLTRAILGAGVRELVASMWPVHDMMTCLFMVAFHEQLRSGPTCVASAIAAAQRSIRTLSPADAAERYECLGGESAVSHRRRTGRELGTPVAAPIDPAHPFHWAPFIHIGS